MNHRRARLASPAVQMDFDPSFDQRIGDEALIQN
jgi:hypothetical protein